MNAAVPTVAHAAAAPAQVVVAPVLQRACACGGPAGPSGQCEACERHDRIGPGAALAITPPDDPFEREAERVAESVVRGGDAGPIARVPGATLSPRHGAGAVPQAVAQGRFAAAIGGGRPLSPVTRAAFEPRFGRDLTHLRLHDGAGAQAFSASIGARAVTHGRDILFAAGALDETDDGGRRLLAHEITHTIQQQGAPVLQREPQGEAEAAEAAEAEPVTIKTNEVTMIVLENPTGERRNTRYVNNEGGLFTFYRPVYARDSLHIALEANFADVGDVQGPLSVRFAAEEVFERSDTGLAGPELTLRVIAEIEEPREERIFLTAPNVDGEMEMVIPLAVLPLDIDPVRDTRLRKRQERKKLRENQRKARQALRAERKIGDEDRDFGAEMEALRDAQKADRKAFRTGRSKAIDAARTERKAEIAASKAEHGDYACSKSQRSNVSKAMKAAISRLDSALAHIRPGEAPDKYRMDKLAHCFRIDPASTPPAELERLQRKALDVLNIARNSMLVSNPATVRCGAPKGECKPRAAAFVRDNVRGNPVTVCQIWLDDNLIFEATKLEPGHEREYALIHEFCHLAGVTDQSSERYLHDDDWQTLSPADAETMADAFAAFAWYMSSPGLE